MCERAHVCMSMHVYVWACKYMYEHTRICMSMHMYVWSCAYMCEHEHICMSTYTYVWACKYMYETHVYVWARTHMYERVHMCESMCMYVWACTYMCEHVNICMSNTYMYEHAHMYEHVHTCTSTCVCAWVYISQARFGEKNRITNKKICESFSPLVFFIAFLSTSVPVCLDIWVTFRTVTLTNREENWILCTLWFVSVLYNLINSELYFLAHHWGFKSAYKAAFWKRITWV